MNSLKPSDFGARVGLTRAEDGTCACVLWEYELGSHLLEFGGPRCDLQQYDWTIESSEDLQVLVERFGIEWLPDTTESLAVLERNFPKRVRTSRKRLLKFLRRE